MGCAREALRPYGLFVSSEGIEISNSLTRLPNPRCSHNFPLRFFPASGTKSRRSLMSNVRSLADSADALQCPPREFHMALTMPT